MSPSQETSHQSQSMSQEQSCTSKDRNEFAGVELKGWKQTESQNVVYKVYERQAQQLFSQAWAHNIGSVLVALCATVALWNVVEHSHLLAWFIIFSAIYICRCVIAHLFHRADPKGSEVRKWVLSQFIAIIASALAYGAPVVFLWPTGYPQEQMVWVITITAVTAAAVARYCVWKFAELPFVFFALIPISLRLFFHDGLTYTVLGTLGILYSFVLLQIGRVMHKANLENLLMGVKHQQLSGDLAQEIEKVTRLNDQLAHEMEERERAFSLMQKREQELEQAKRMEAIGVLSGGVAHEINTPLQFIDSNLRFLDEGLSELQNFTQKVSTVPGSLVDSKSVELVSRQIEAIKEESDVEYFLSEMGQARSEAQEGISRIGKIVRALGLHASSVTSGAPTADINEVIESAVLLSHNTWKDVCTVTTKYQEGLPEVRCNANDFSQIIMGLLMNGMQAIQDKKENHDFEGGITISTTCADKYLQISIADNGIGIPDNIKAKVFEDLFTTREPGKGVGLGLSFAYRTLKKHGGSISFESLENIGSTFTIKLPVKS